MLLPARRGADRIFVDWAGRISDGFEFGEGRGVELHGPFTGWQD